MEEKIFKKSMEKGNTSKSSDNRFTEPAVYEVTHDVSVKRLIVVPFTLVLSVIPVYSKTGQVEAK